jgi:autotransporter-associated beta strand protein
MSREDSYANAVLVFQTRNDASYTSHNNVSRASALSYGQLDQVNPPSNPAGLAEYMLSEVRFNGQFMPNTAVDRSASLVGWPIMFVKNLSGAAPKLTLEATATTSNKFSFNVNMDVVLHDSLDIVGNSDQGYAINGQIREFRNPASITKSGTSTITLSGNNTYTGDTVVNGGTLRIAGGSAALANTAKVQIGAQGTVRLESGLIRTPLLENNSGGAFDFTGGTLETSQVAGSLLNNGGVFKPGLSTGIVDISGSFGQTSGSIVTEIGGLAAGTQHDQVIANTMALGGTLQISLVNSFNPALGNAFEIMKAGGGITGQFASISAPALGAGKQWAIQNTGQSVTLQVVAGLAADFDHNNMVDGNDLSLWRTNLGTGAGGDADLDGDSDAADYLIWQREFGLKLVPATPAFSAVPEPNMAIEALALGVAAAMGRRRAGAARPVLVR